MQGETLLKRQNVGVLRLRHTAKQEGFTLRVQHNSRVVPFDVTADARGLTGRAGLGLVAETSKAVGLSRGLSQALGGVRSWSLHDPGKVVRDVALTLADGGDALRHIAVIDRQPALFGLVASPATACRTVTAVAEDPDAMAGLAAARAAARDRAWRCGVHTRRTTSASPTSTAAITAYHSARRLLKNEIAAVPRTANRAPMTTSTLAMPPTNATDMRNARRRELPSRVA
jgi:hypothetical protein